MHIPKVVFKGLEADVAIETIRQLGLTYNTNEEFIIVNCPVRGKLNEEYVLDRIFEATDGYKSIEAAKKQYAIRAMTRLYRLLSKLPERRDDIAVQLAAVAAVNSLFPIAPEISVRLINYVVV